MPAAASTMPTGLRCTRPRRSMVAEKSDAWLATASLKARASSTAFLAWPIAPVSPWYPVSIDMTLLAGNDLPDHVAERERAGEADDGTLTDEIGRNRNGLIHRLAGLFHHLLRILHVEVVQDALALTVGALC